EDGIRDDLVTGVQTCALPICFQFAGPRAFVYLILAYLTFLIPGAFITSHLGRMFPKEGSIYVWTHKALGPFWGFFAGFVAWWPRSEERRVGKGGRVAVARVLC